MNGVAWGIAIVAVSAGTTVAVQSLSSGSPSADDGRVEALAARMDAIEGELSSIGDELGAIRSLAARLDGPGGAAAQRRLTASMQDEEIPPLADAGRGAPRGAADAEAEETEEESLDLEAFAAQLRAGGMSDEEIEAMWRRIAKAGKIEDAIDVLEELAELHPNDPDLQAHLGSAYIQKLMTVNDLARGVWAMKADGAFDNALELNPQHWDARFSKAISLSFWPPIMGKQPEAIKQFETLLENQENSGFSQPKHAQTYQFLGNLYLQSGDHAKAKEIFEKGLAAFPGNDALAQAMADFD